MSDNAPVLPESFGVPFVVLFTPDGDILRDFDEIPISKYLTEFEYEYNEDEDDTCTMKFRFESLRSFDLPYFQQDIIMKVQWGLLLPGGSTVVSPTRKVAIRDLETLYKSDSIELELKCTDLVSYLKNYQTKTISRYQEVGSSPNEIKRVNIFEDGILGLIQEAAKGQFNATLTHKDNFIRITKSGETKAAKYNLKTNEYTQAVDNVRVKKTIVDQFHVNKSVKGKSQSFKNMVSGMLNQMNDQSAGTGGAGGGGPYIQDTTDDNIDMKQRNFNQNIYKTFTYFGGSGELINFKSNTNTRKDKHDIAVSSGVNPYSKRVESTTLATADTTNNDRRIPEGAIVKQIIKSDSGRVGNNFVDNSQPKPTEAVLKQYYRDVRQSFGRDFENLFDQKGIPDLKFSYIKYEKAGYMGTSVVALNKVVTIPAKVVLNMPEFRAIAKNRSAAVRAQFHRESILTGYTVEKIQRKYEADADVIGDPTLIKGKVVYINNVGRLDTGKWYIVKCKHKINMGSGYMCNMNLVRNPKTVGLHLKRYAANPKFDRSTNTLTFEKESSDTNMEIYKEENTTTAGTTDNKYNDVYKEEGIVSMEDRAATLKAEEDVKFGKDNEELEPLKKEDYEELIKPNTDQH